MTATVATTADPQFAANGVTRVMSLCLQAGAIILFGLNVTTAFGQAPQFPSWWSGAAVTVILAPAITALAASRWIPARQLRALCGIQSVGYLLVLLAAPLALGGERLPATMGLPWLADLSVIAGSAAAVAWGTWGALGYGIALQATVFLLVFVSAGNPVPGNALGDAVFGVLFVTLFTALALALQRAAATLDHTIASAVSDSRAAAAADATRAARRRVASLIHDSVIVALLSYGRGVAGATAAGEAERALTAIRGIQSPEPSQDRDPTAFAWELQALTTESDPEAGFEYEVGTDEPLPAAAADAIGEATAEALRNSVRHNAHNPRVSREVRVTIDAGALEVLILDDGAGFDPAAVAPARLGIRHGIVGRLEAVPGGSARVTSIPGYGTTVALRWSRP